MRTMNRHFTPRKVEHRRHDYEYTRCFECGHTYYDPIEPLGKYEPGFGRPNLLDALYAVTPADMPLLSKMEGEFVWEGSDEE